jgi:hypothetical protein
MIAVAVQAPTAGSSRTTRRMLDKVATRARVMTVTSLSPLSERTRYDIRELFRFAGLLPSEPS